MKKLLIIFSLIAAGCTTHPATEEKRSTPTPILSEDQQAAGRVLRCISDASSHSCSLYAEGSITLKDGNSSQSGHFELKSKRLQSVSEPQRIDSLSMIITGPFGITGAKFLGAPQEYQFYNAIEGEKYRGRPDPKTLQSMTGMKGLTLESLSDVLYGLAPNASEIAPADSIKLKSTSEYRHVLYILRPSGVMEAITVNGKLPAAGEDAKLTIIQYERWNAATHIPDSGEMPKADISISYQGLYENKDFALPNYITARSGMTQLEIEYTSADQNPKNLTVKIKMPQ